MGARTPTVVVTFPPEPEDRAAIRRELQPHARVAYLRDRDDEERAGLLRTAEVLLVWLWDREVWEGEEDLVASVRLIQTVTAGLDAVPWERIPATATVASNAGAYATPMAEHVVAMVLALAKRLLPRHLELSRGEFNALEPNRRLQGAACGILGFGGIGKAVARLLRPFDVRIHAINSSGTTDEPVDFVGTLADLPEVLEVSDVVVVALPLTTRTRGLIGREELARMRHDAILVNVARGALVDERALYEHLRAHPDFSAGIDTWWEEPFGRGHFRTAEPFFELPNFLGSPHNSAIVPGMLQEAVRRAASNVGRWLRGEEVAGVARREDYVEATPPSQRGRASTSSPTRTGPGRTTSA